MFVLPKFVDYYEQEGSIFITSHLRQNIVRLSDPLIIEEFKSVLCCGGCMEISTPLQHFLHEQEMLLNEYELYQAIAEVRETINDVLLVTIMPTEGCNFRCPYCYEDHRPISMTRNLLNQIMNYITQKAPLFRHVNIAWFGGEPTLCKDAILETNKILLRLQSTNAFSFSSSMTTNGYLLSLETFKAFYRAGIISYQITIDGWNHDKTRPHITEKGTLQRILDNLTAISKLSHEEYSFNIILRHNILHGDEDYSWYDYLSEKFGNDPRFSVLIRPVCDWGGDSIQSLSILKEDAADKLVKKHIAYLKQIGLRCENEKKGLLSQVCYASYPNSMVFRSDGKIEKCTVCLDHPQNLIGRVDEFNGVIIDDNQNRMWYYGDLKSECYQCKDVLSCLNLQCRKRLLVDRFEGDCHSSVPLDGILV